MPTVLIGAMVDKVPNFMPVAFIGIVNYKPAIVACGGVLEVGGLYGGGLERRKRI
jgi:hypothetical protein